MDLELLVWQTAFTIYVTLHLVAKFRRFLAKRRNKRAYRIRNGQSWFWF